MLGVLVCMLFGGMVGWIASLFAGTATQVSAATYLTVSIIGSVIGSFVGQAFSQTGPQNFNFYELTFAIIGAIIGVIMLGLFRRVLRTS